MILLITSKVLVCLTKRAISLNIQMMKSYLIRTIDEMWSDFADKKHYPNL